MRNFVEISSFVVILVGSIIFGLLGKPIEMGLLIASGAVSLFFLNLEKFSSFKAAGIEANLRDKIEAVVEKETEPFIKQSSDLSGEEENPVPETSLIDKNTRKVIEALHHPEYTWRYLEGLKQDTKLNASEIKSSLRWLIDHGYARQSFGKYGTIWNLTEHGRYLNAVIGFEDVKAK